METSTVEVYELHAIITDFGLSRPVDLPRLHDQGNYELFHGTEILQGQKESLASDVYAFGIIMWEFSASERLTFYEWDHLSLIHNIVKVSTKDS
ncbi:hypothetical protein RhiirA4_363594 [Rhizophagus irregularis]|uniref:Protein kinase domain-containing protein n=1 Tax=Rhizophagus irregularis TaxID=588596 RepID=A0A2I1HDV2_9GLOM|nr:hypothetical protein RhiirA4_363594 [Rhizophagus irregularis]